MFERIEYRNANVDDVPRIIELIREKYGDSYPKDWFREGEKGVTGKLNDFIIASKGDEVLGCVAHNSSYWPGINVTYLESLVVSDKATGNGIGTQLTKEIIKTTGRNVITLDRYTSINLMLKIGFNSIGFLPYREFFDGNRESLMLAYHGSNNSETHNDKVELQPGINKARIKVHNGKNYLLEIVGNNIEAPMVVSQVDKNSYPEYIQIVNQHNAKFQQKLADIEGYQRFYCGSFNISALVVDIYAYISEGIAKNPDFLDGFNKFMEKLSHDKNSVNVLNSFAKQLLRR